MAGVLSISESELEEQSHSLAPLWSKNFAFNDGASFSPYTTDTDIKDIGQNNQFSGASRVDNIRPPTRKVTQDPQTGGAYYVR